MNVEDVDHTRGSYGLLRCDTILHAWLQGVVVIYVISYRCMGTRRLQSGILLLVLTQRLLGGWCIVVALGIAAQLVVIIVLRDARWLSNLQLSMRRVCSTYLHSVSFIRDDQIIITTLLANLLLYCDN